MLITDWIIDCDTHITEPGDVWTSRLPARFADRAPRMERLEDGQDAWLFGSYEQPIPVGFTAVAGWPRPFPAAPRNMEEVPPAAYDAKARLEYMDSIGIWAMALYPNIGGFGNEGFLGLGDPELMLACVRAYNDWLAEWCEPDPRRFIGIMATPFWDVDATVEEVRRCRDLGHRGILFTGEPHRFGQPFIGDKHWDPLWKVAAELELPVNLHIGSGDLGKDLSMARMQAHGVGSTIATTSVGLFLGNAAQITDLLLSGVLPRHPDTRFVAVESGIGWVPFVLEACDYTFGYSEMAKERPIYTAKPSEYFRRQVSACTFFESLAPTRMLDVIGVDNILFETDYPHPVCLYGNVREKVDEVFGHLPREVQRSILWENAAALYDVVEPDGPWEPAAT